MNNYIESHETVLCWPTLELHHDFESNKTTFKNCPIKKIRAERRFSLIQTSHHCLSSKWSILPSRREGFVLNWPVDAEWSVKGLFPAPIQSPGSWLNVRAQLGPGDWWQDSTLVRAAIKPSALRPRLLRASRSLHLQGRRWGNVDLSWPWAYEKTSAKGTVFNWE